MKTNRYVFSPKIKSTSIRHSFIADIHRKTDLETTMIPITPQMTQNEVQRNFMSIVGVSQIEKKPHLNMHVYEDTLSKT